MKTINKKFAFILIGIITIFLAAGSILFAAENTFDGREPVLGIISAVDADSVTGRFTAGDSGKTAWQVDFSGREPVLAGISSADVAFASRAFESTITVAVNGSGFSGRESVIGLLSTADVNNVSNGRFSADEFGGTLVCVVDGVQLSGSKNCVQ